LQLSSGDRAGVTSACNRQYGCDQQSTDSQQVMFLYCRWHVALRIAERIMVVRSTISTLIRQCGVEVCAVSLERPRNIQLRCKPAIPRACRHTRLAVDDKSLARKSKGRTVRAVVRLPT
jgi:hypothetical protein